MKLTKEIVDSMRKEYIPWKMSLKKLGKKYGVSHTTVLNVIKGYIWNKNNPSSMYYASPKHTADQVVIRGVLPTAKDEKELKKWCTVASNRAMNDDVKNPY